MLIALYKRFEFPRLRVSVLKCKQLCAGPFWAHLCHICEAWEQELM